MPEDWQKRAMDAEDRLKIMEVDLKMCRAANLAAKALYQSAQADLTTIAENMGAILGMNVPVDDLKGIMAAAIQLANKMYPEEFEVKDEPTQPD